MARACSVIFTGSKVQYDYLLLPHHDVRVGDNVTVPTKRGEATVIVTAVLEHSGKATKPIAGVVGKGSLL